MLLPGPEAQQLAIYMGWLLHRTAGGIAAGALFVLPSMFVLWGLSFVYAAYGNVPGIAAVFYDLKAAVLAIVAIAVIRIGRKALKNPLMWSIAALGFIGIFFLHISFPLIIFGALLVGFVGGIFQPQLFAVQNPYGAAETISVLDDDDANVMQIRPSWSRALRVALWAWRSGGCRFSPWDCGKGGIPLCSKKGAFSAGRPL